MYRNSLLDNPFAIFILFLLVIFANVILSVHFITIFLAGVVFMEFIRCLEKRYYYSMVLVVLSFLLIESSQGLKPFSLLLVSLFLYIFIIPKSKQILTSQSLYTFFLLLIFYISIIVLYIFLGDINSHLVSNITINYLFDIFIISAII